MSDSISNATCQYILLRYIEFIYTVKENIGNLLSVIIYLQMVYLMKRLQINYFVFLFSLNIFNI